MTFFDVLTRLAAWTDADLAKPWMHGTRATNLRYALYRTLEEEQEAVVATRRPANEAARIIALAQAAFGDLRGLLAGVPDDLLDRAPAAGEWPIRETLHHALQVELAYRAQTRWAIERTEADPVAFPAERRPRVAPAEVAGPVAGIVARLERERAETDRYAASLPDDALGRASVWASLTVDTRFRLHRFASHYAEHTVQCETTLERLGFARGDAPRVVRAISGMRGLHEHATAPERLAVLDAAYAARAAALA